MSYYIIKVVITAILVVAISEISKRSSLIGAILASLPIVSVLAFIWLYIDTKSAEKISELSTGIFWLVIPSLSLFLVLPILLKSKVNFYLSLFISCVIMTFFYFSMLFILKKLNINLWDYTDFYLKADKIARWSAKQHFFPGLSVESNWEWKK